MIASIIGNTFLKEYNRRHRTSYSSEEFFNEIFHPIFYDHDKYLQWVTNSPFVQGITTSDSGLYGKELDKASMRNQDEFNKKLKKLQKEYGESRISIKTDSKKKQYKILELNDSIQRKDRLKEFSTKVDTTTADASFAIGYPSTDVFATTSGQLSAISLPVSKKAVYASWIGGGLGVGLAGGYSVYFNDPQILYDIFIGWKCYRNFLEEYKNLRPNQIETWNGQWLTVYYNEDCDEQQSFAGIVEYIETDKNGILSIPTQKWTEVLFAICRHLGPQDLMGYVFSLGQTNKTIGFIPFKLPEIVMPLQFYVDIFGENEFLEDRNKLRSLYGTAYGFASACEKGVIGTSALEPKDLRQYMNRSAKNARLPDYSKAKKDQLVTFNVYQTWLLAMLGKKEYWDRANEIAQVYVNFESEALEVKKTSTKPGHMIEYVLKAPVRQIFIEANIQLLQTLVNSVDSISNVVKTIHFLPEESFVYFLTLLKFRYGHYKIRKGESHG